MRNTLFVVLCAPAVLWLYACYALTGVSFTLTLCTGQEPDRL